MDFIVELYETAAGQLVVQEELLTIKRRRRLFTLLIAGLSKLRNRSYHGPPFSVSLAKGYLKCGSEEKIVPARSGFSVGEDGLLWCGVLLKRAKDASGRTGTGAAHGRLSGAAGR